MSNADFPATAVAGQAESDEGATNGPDRLGQLPDRVRVHALAKLLGSSSREVLVKLGELGETARSPQSSVPRSTALRVAEMFDAAERPSGAAEQAPEAASAPTTETSTAQPPEAGTSGDETSVTSTFAAGSGQASGSAHVPMFAAPSPVFLPPEPVPERAPRSGPESPDQTQQKASPAKEQGGTEQDDKQQDDTSSAESGTAAQGEGAEDSGGEQADSEGDDGSRKRRRRGRRGRGRGRGTEGGSAEGSDSTDQDAGDGDAAEQDGGQRKQQDKQQSGQPDKQDSGADKQAGGKQQSDDKQTGGKQSGGKQQGEAGSGDGAGDKSGGDDGSEAKADAESESAGGGEESKRRRRRRRRKGGGDDSSTGDDPPNTVTHVREHATGDRNTDSDGVKSVRGSTRLEAKRQRRRDGREAGRRRAPILSEAEFLARRESVERTMVVAEKDGSTQIGVLEDDVLVEHFVTSSGSGSIVGNVYLGRVQNVLPSMEAAFIDIGRGRNAVLYAGEVDWDSAGLEGKARKIEQALSSGDQVLVQVTKDPLGHKGARLTTQISLPGRFLVYVPSGGTTGISRKLPESERRRLKDILKRVVPEDAGVIIRTASEGISEQELERDVQRLREQWETVKQRSESASNSSGSSKSKKSGAPTLLYEEPDLLVKVVRDLFTEDFRKMEIQGEKAWQTIFGYVEKVAPELSDRVKRYVGTGDVFADYRIDEQITKALDRKVWLPSGGYLVIDRTEAMTVIDVNTGKFTGSGGNLEETVTRNNLESAEEIVRQLRLRDIGGIIVIDFIDMVLESNRELVLRRLTECLGRDRTRHQVAEVTSLGLVQMTRKRLGTGLLESFSTTCEHCKGRGLHITTEPNKGSSGGNGGGQSGSRKRGKGEQGSDSSSHVSNGPTQHQRESAANAVAVMANAAKAAPSKSGEQDRNGGQATGPQPDTEPAAATAATAESAASTGTPDSAASVAPAEPQTAPVQRGNEQDEQPVPAGEQREPSAQQEPPRSASRPVGRRARRAVSRPAGPPV